jgi:hypothetical protein
MHPGFIPDFGTFATWMAVWMPGEPKFEKTVWEAFRTGGGVATDRSAARMIEAHCCAKCGMVQLYARKPVPAGAMPG